MVIKINYTSSDVYVSTSVSPVYVVVNYSGTSGGGGAAVWGGISGTLSDQTDLQDALDDKVPYTGAIADVDLGEFELKAGQVEFDQTPTGTAGVGVMRWNDTDGTLDLGLKGGNVTLQIGQEQVIRVVNKTGANLLESQYKVCRVRTQAEGGAQGQRLAVVLAQANTKANHSGVLGVVTENINNNQEGFITNFGNVQSVNTTGSLQGETWADGNVLWLSETVAGGLTNIEPTTHPVQIGYVLYAHVNNGKIFVSLEAGVDELKELHDVAADAPANNEALIYESSTSLWKNKTIASALGYTPVSGSGVSGQVSYWNGTSSQTGSNNLFWDAANSRLGIGTNTPTATLTSNGKSLFGASTTTYTANHVFQGITDIITLLVRTSVGAASNIQEWYNGNNQRAYLNASGDLYAGRIRTTTNNISFPPLGFSANSQAGFAYSTGIAFVTTNTQRATLFDTTGNLVLQNGGTFSDGGQRLQVIGDAFIKGSGATSATTGLTVQNNDGTTTLRVRNDGNIFLGSTSTSVLYPTVNGTTINIAGSPALMGGTGGYPSVFIGRQSAVTNTFAGTQELVRIIGDFTPTSGGHIFEQLRLQSTINQTGGANGITRGLYVNPTLTAAADWRSIEMSNNSGWGIYQSGASANNYLAGKLLIGLTSPSTFALDVNGTARVSGAMTFGSALLLTGATGATVGSISLDSVNGLTLSAKSGSTYDFVVYDKNGVRAISFGTSGFVSSAGTYGGIKIGISGSPSVFLDSTFGLAITGTGTSIDAALFERSGLNFAGINSSGNFRIGAYNSTYNASAILEAVSTTKGFLPPRMTTTQKNAIGTPAAGLQVYDTTLNQMSYYNGTSWVNF